MKVVRQVGGSGCRLVLPACQLPVVGPMPQSPSQQRTSVLPTQPRIQDEHPPSWQQPPRPRIVAASGLVNDSGFLEAQTAFHHSLKTYAGPNSKDFSPHQVTPHARQNLAIHLIRKRSSHHLPSEIPELTKSNLQYLMLRLVWRPMCGQQSPALWEAVLPSSKTHLPKSGSHHSCSNHHGVRTAPQNVGLTAAAPASLPPAGHHFNLGGLTSAAELLACFQLGQAVASWRIEFAPLPNSTPSTSHLCHLLGLVGRNCHERNTRIVHVSFRTSREYSVKSSRVAAKRTLVPRVSVVEEGDVSSRPPTAAERETCCDQIAANTARFSFIFAVVVRGICLTAFLSSVVPLGGELCVGVRGRGVGKGIMQQLQKVLTLPGNGLYHVAESLAAKVRALKFYLRLYAVLRAGVRCDADIDRRPLTPDCKGGGVGERESREKTLRPAASPGTISTRGDPGATPCGTRTRFALVRSERSRAESPRSSPRVTLAYNANYSPTRQKNGVTAQHNVGTPFAIRCLVIYSPTCSPVNRRLTTAGSSQLETTPVPRTRFLVQKQTVVRERKESQGEDQRRFVEIDRPCSGEGRRRRGDLEETRRQREERKNETALKEG
ncbi:hypothetical protein PR048_027081 [Dryococelus australis]|uniref:Uncharacterized protein n=1 Tax=Dryococelus australis TaxID=614101 RepID=A0ABQ9GEZ6_9NEOP|nr:hypothetical protein PR048_027081 [Dryococelus australis]